MEAKNEAIAEHEEAKNEAITEPEDEAKNDAIAEHEGDEAVQEINVYFHPRSHFDQVFLLFFICFFCFICSLFN